MKFIRINSSRDAYLKFQNGGSGTWQLRQGFLIKIPIMDTPFELQHLRCIIEFSKALFPSCLQAGCCVNGVLDGSWVHCGKVLKATWSCLLQHWNKELCILLLTMRVIILEHPTSGVVLKFQKWNPSRPDHHLLRLLTELSEGKERLYHVIIWMRSYDWCQ